MKWIWKGSSGSRGPFSPPGFCTFSFSWEENTLPIIHFNAKSIGGREFENKSSNSKKMESWKMTEISSPDIPSLQAFHIPTHTCVGTCNKQREHSSSITLPRLKVFRAFPCRLCLYLCMHIRYTMECMWDVKGECEEGKSQSNLDKASNIQWKLNSWVRYSI